MHLTIAYNFLPKTASTHAAMVMDHFGVGFDAGRHVIADNLELPIAPGDIVLFTGPSGSGKSSLLRAAATELARNALSWSPLPRLGGEGQGERADVPDDSPSLNALACVPLAPPVQLSHDSPTATDNSVSQNHHVLNIDSLDLGNQILVDGLRLPAEETFTILTSCGLGEARLMLRSPAELSDGQRYRYRLALALSNHPNWIVADEFTATLDRTLAKVIAFNLGKTVRRRNTGVLLATTHDDIVDDLQPDLHVRCRLDGEIEITRQAVKKNESASPATSPSRPARNQTGRTLLAGITAATTSVSSAG